jgi:hypothetical protein
VNVFMYLNVLTNAREVLGFKAFSMAKVC